MDQQQHDNQRLILDLQTSFPPLDSQNFLILILSFSLQLAFFHTFTSLATLLVTRPTEDLYINHREDYSHFDGTAD